MKTCHVYTLVCVYSVKVFKYSRIILYFQDIGGIRSNMQDYYEEPPCLDLVWIRGYYLHYYLSDAIATYITAKQLRLALSSFRSPSR